ncbi:MAG TPA: hypothetical protein VN089_17270 [Duganella sp.]|nr:hypothetical protein [Duganella sp.]
MNRFNLMTYTAAVALAISACASASRPGALGAQRQQLLLASTGYTGRQQQVGAAGRRPASGRTCCRWLY